jgi:hypothetical protein
MTTYVKPTNADATMWAKTVAFMEKQSTKRASVALANEEATAKAASKELLRQERVQFNDYIKSEGSRRRQALINDEVFVPNGPPAPVSSETAAEQALLLAQRAKDFLKYERYQASAQAHYQKVIAARPELSSNSG